MLNAEMRVTIAQSLFESWKRRVRIREALLGETPPPGRSYSTDAWHETPPSFQSSFLEDADDVLRVLAPMLP